MAARPTEDRSSRGALLIEPRCFEGAATLELPLALWTTMLSFSSSFGLATCSAFGRDLSTQDGSTRLLAVSSPLLRLLPKLWPAREDSRSGLSVGRWRFKARRCRALWVV